MNNLNEQEFIPRESLERAFQRWWLIVLLSALGGIAGLAIHFLRPPLFEATAVMTVTMDFHKAKLTQREQDIAFNAAGAIANSTIVSDQITAEAHALGIPIDVSRLSEQMFLERRQSVWEFHVRNGDPDSAAKLANLWAEKTYDSLKTALGHAIQADQIQAQITTITSNQLSPGSATINPEIQATLKTLSDNFLQENQLSLGVVSIMKFALTRLATVPQIPALYNLADLVLAGACVGFIISLWVMSRRKVLSRG
jgi:hypothetical protein